MDSIEFMLYACVNKSIVISSIITAKDVRPGM